MLFWGHIILETSAVDCTDFAVVSRIGNTAINITYLTSNLGLSSKQNLLSSKAQNTQAFLWERPVFRLNLYCTFVRQKI